MAGTFHEQAYGAVVSVHLREPSTKNSTFVTPTLSEAAAVIFILDFLCTLLPLRGNVIDTVGGVVSEGAERITLIGPYDARGSFVSFVTPPQCFPSSSMQLLAASNTWIPYQNMPDGVSSVTPDVTSDLNTAQPIGVPLLSSALQSSVRATLMLSDDVHVIVTGESVVADPGLAMPSTLKSVTTGASMS